MKPETAFRARVGPWLKTLPDTAVFPIQQMGIVGDPDFILCIRGKFVALELKAENGSLSQLQAKKLELIDKAGGRGYVARPSNWGQVKARLTDLATGRIV